MLSEDPLDYLTPDIVVFGADVPLTTRPIPGLEILVVVEVVSRGSRREDRGAKPLAYAEGGLYRERFTTGDPSPSILI